MVAVQRKYVAYKLNIIIYLKIIRESYVVFVTTIPEFFYMNHSNVFFCHTHVNELRIYLFVIPALAGIHCIHKVE